MNDWTAAFIELQGDLTLPELAARTGVPLRSLANYRSGTIPRAAQYERLARAMPGLPPPPSVQQAVEARASLEQRVADLEVAVLALIDERDVPAPAGQPRTGGAAMAERQAVLARLRARHGSRRGRAVRESGR